MTSMDIYELQDRLGDELCDKAADSFDAIVLEAYVLGKQDGAREALDVSQYVNAEPLPTPDYDADYDEGCGLDCSYCYPDAKEADISSDLLAALDALTEDDTIYVTIGDVQIPLDTFIELLADDLNDLEGRLNEIEERTEAVEYETGLKYVG